MSKMGLVDYSDSEASGDEESSNAKAKPQPKSGFTKVVDRSNPHKIRVQLPATASEHEADDQSTEEQRPMKRQRTGAGAFSGFNSLLPAPKRTGAAAGGGGGNPSSASKAISAPKINLKTGAEPAFARGTEPRLAEREEKAVSEESHDDVLHINEETNEAQGPTGLTADVPSTGPPQSTKTEPIAARKATMFKPLSVARQHQKKKKVASANQPTSPAVVASTLASTAAIPPKPAPKVSLFSLGGTEESAPTSPPEGEYKPMIYETRPTGADDPAIGSADSTLAEAPQQAADPGYEAPATEVADDEATSLDAIANDLGLSKAARRQLLGRQAAKASAGPNPQQNQHGPSAVKVINFNTDQEYLANEALRAAGETVQQNPVRAIAPGKHNLKQLVNAAHTQRDALEEHFATSRRNKKEAGSRYGW